MIQTSSSALILGAGSVGRGFIGQLFSESGYEVILADVDAGLVDALNRRGAYTLRLAGVVSTVEHTISPVRAIDATMESVCAIRPAESLAEAVCSALAILRPA